ncbi:MAG: extracellular solute-binding protein [Tyzzerella sp.]|nr:extracellular solute-binding protein [Tyzzerella sp.]
MKRFLALILALTMVLATLTGCGGNDTEKDKDKEQGGTDSNVEVNTEIKGEITVGINSYRNSDFEAICEAFKAQYPNVEVKPILFETTKDDAVEYLTSQSMAEKDLPDVMFDDAGSLPTYIQNGWMYPLTSFVENDADWEKVPQNIRDNFTYNGNIYALPQTIHSNVLVVNEDLVEEMNVDLPEYDWTWDDFTEFIKACTNATYSGVDDMSKMYNWIPGAMTDGHTVGGYNYDTKSFNLEAVRTYVNYFLELQKLNGVEVYSLYGASNGGESAYVKKFGNISGTNAPFLAGKVASTFVGTWDYATYNKKDLDFNWEFYPIPQTTAGRVPIHVDYCWMTTSIAEENVEAAWAFLRYVTYSKEGNIARLTTYDEDHITDDMNYVYYIPVTTDEEVLAKFESLPYVTDQILYIFDNLENGYINDPEKTVPGIETLVWGDIGVLAFESMTGRDDFSSKMKDAETKANAEMAAYWKTFEDALAKFETEFEQSH